MSKQIIKRVKKNNITGIRKQWLQAEHTLFLSDRATFQPLVTFHNQLAATNCSRSEHHLVHGVWSKSITGPTSSLTSGILTTSDTVASLGFTKTTQFSLERKALCLYHDRKPHVGGADHLLGQPCPTATAAETHSHRILAGTVDRFNEENDSLYSNSQTSQEGLLCPLPWFKNGMSFLT